MPHIVHAPRTRRPVPLPPAALRPPAPHPCETLLAPPDLWATLSPSTRDQLRRIIRQVVLEVMDHADQH